MEAGLAQGESGRGPRHPTTDDDHFGYGHTPHAALCVTAAYSRVRLRAALPGPQGDHVVLARWRFLAVPLAIWLAAVSLGVASLRWVQFAGREATLSRFEYRVDLAADFVSSMVSELFERQQEQASALLTDRTVDPKDLAQAVTGLGYSSGLLLDDRGRVLQAMPPDPDLLGQDVTGRHSYLRSSVFDGQPAMSTPAPSALGGMPETVFAVPFSTEYGRRVFSAAVKIGESPFASYLSTSLNLEGGAVQLVDSSGAIVAANRTLDPPSTALRTHVPELASAMTLYRNGRYDQDGYWWRYTSAKVQGTPWRLSAAVTEEVLFSSAKSNEFASEVAVFSASAVGLLVVASSARARRRRRELQLGEVFDNARIGMLLTDPDGRLTRVNPAFCQMLGRPADELIGRDFTEYSHPDDAEAGRAEMADCVAGRSEGFALEKRYLHADGRTVEGSVTAAVLRDPAGRPRHFATQVLDVTERRALERARDRQAAELAERADQLADFIAMLTHDVRQPLTNVVSGGEMLLDEWPDLDDETRCKYVQRMIAAGHRAGNLVEEVLMIAQLDAGALVARRSEFDVGDLVREAVAAHGANPAEPITVIASENAFGVADTTHLLLILANLLGNAVKYGAPPVTVTVADDGGTHVRILVSDEGEGVPEDFVPRLFDRFARADSGVATTKPGTGLGLYLVRQLADASGVRIAYERNRPRGSIFVLTLERAVRRAR
ncbi:sensor histidine kinase [Actinoplanes subglobosus]|uniref:Sensor-like histidine kinase SenX3 n=1 Tax=Actinoplanes subglobosus TaxID=1547892 RepID=A0ABV8IXB5_9ACTN